jgi:hypothetical protein
MLKLPRVYIGKKNLPLILAAASFVFGPAGVRAQDPGPPARLDFARMREQELKRIREQLEITDDAEWKLVSERVTRVLDLSRTVRSFDAPPRMAGPGGMNPPPSRDGDRESAAGGPPGPPPGESLSAPGGGPDSRPSTSPEAEALQESVKSKASNADLQQKLAKLQAARKKAQAELSAAQAQLQQVLSVRQEAIALTIGLL